MTKKVKIPMISAYVQSGNTCQVETDTASITITTSEDMTTFEDGKSPSWTFTLNASDISKLLSDKHNSVKETKADATESIKDDIQFRIISGKTVFTIGAPPFGVTN